MTEDDKMQIFGKASQLGPQETRFYLETSAWDLPKALAEWRAEHRWEVEQVRGDGLRTRARGGDWGLPPISFPGLSGNTGPQVVLAMVVLGEEKG